MADGKAKFEHPTRANHDSRPPQYAPLLNQPRKISQLRKLGAAKQNTRRANTFAVAK